MKKFASEFYRNRQGNCAQAVAAAWQRKTALNEVPDEVFADCGHGKAPDGLCGALYAAHCMIDKESAGKLDVRFREVSGGHTKCRDIRGSGKLSCVGCVEVAAGLLDEHLTALADNQQAD